MRPHNLPIFALLSLALGLAALNSGCGRSASAPAEHTSAQETASAQAESASAPGLRTEESPPAASTGNSGSSPVRPSSSPETAVSASTPETGKTTTADSSIAPEAGEAPTSAVPVPQLPETGLCLEDFTPDGWTLMDSVSLDFNRDGRPDYVGVLEMTGDDVPLRTPRILFAVAGCQGNFFRLDFQDENLIRTRDEGGVFGDPYVPMTAGDTSFTTNAFGGSAWKWSEAYTYAYRDGAWYLNYVHTTYGYGPFVTSESEDDYETGVGIRRERSLNRELLDAQTPRDGGFDLVYQVRLDDPPNISQAGKRWWLSPYRLTGCPMKNVAIADSVGLDPSLVKPPTDGNIRFRDENMILYTFTDESGRKNYLACYQEEDQSLTVAAEGTEELPAFDFCCAYKGKVYFAADVQAHVLIPDDSGTASARSATVAQKLFSMNPDGSGRQEIFEYRLANPGDTISQSYMPYLSMICEITGDEIIVQVYIGGQPHPYYRMNLDGSNVRQIGFLPDDL
ncbi:MAG: hypothetical protein KH230_14660 [Enterocloster asparagiformis]|nr:hypothetical protein [Enterocloster asparagiformis]